MHNQKIINKNQIDNDKINNKLLLVTYESSSLKYNDKIKFYYALKGRDSKSGIEKLYNIKFLGKKVFLINYKFKDDIKSFFKLWNLNFNISEIIILSEEKNDGENK
jgi:hypothetical protein